MVAVLHSLEVTDKDCVGKTVENVEQKLNTPDKDGKCGSHMHVYSKLKTALTWPAALKAAHCSRAVIRH